MIYRAANEDDHELIVKQVRSNYIQNALLLTPVIPVAVLAMCLSENMMYRDNYDEETIVVCTVIYALMLIGAVVFILFLMNDDYKELNYGRIVRALAISAIVVCVTILVYQTRISTLNEISLQRFGTIKVEEESEFMASFNPNILAVLCILPIVCISQLMVRKESKPPDVLLIAALALFAIMTMSRKVVLLGIVLLLLLILDQRDPLGVLKWVILFAAAIAIVFGVLNAFFPDTIETFSSRFEVEDVSNGRIDLFVQYHHYLFDKVRNMMFGIGLQDNLTRLTSMGFVNVPHNGLQELLVVWGVPGFVAFLILLGSFFKFAGKEKGKMEFINILPFAILFVGVQTMQLITDGRTLILFGLSFLSLRYTFRKGKRQEENTGEIETSDPVEGSDPEEEPEALKSSV